MAGAQVIGVGIDPAPATEPERFRSHLGIEGPYVLYAGRVQKEKGCDAMFDHYLRLPTETKKRFPLVVLGKAAMPIPDSPYIRYGGFVSDDLKQSAFAGASLVLIPSPYESLSLVALEAWSSGVAVLVNGDRDVLKNQCRRSQGGLWDHRRDEFREAFLWLTDPPHQQQLRALAQNGRAYVEQSHRWDIVVGKYRGLLDDAGGAAGAIRAQ